MSDYLTKELESVNDGINEFENPMIKVKIVVDDYWNPGYKQTKWLLINENQFIAMRDALTQPGID